MIDITSGFTSICVGSDPITAGGGSRRPTGARVTVDFCRETPLAGGQAVRAHYEFVDGQLRTAIGVAVPTRTAMPWGRPVVFHYRLSHWIEPAAAHGEMGVRNPEQQLLASTQRSGGQSSAEPGDRFPS